MNLFQTTVRRRIRLALASGLLSSLLLQACATQPAPLAYEPDSSVRQTVCTTWGYDADASYCAPASPARTASR